MDANAVRSDRLDELDAERFREMISSLPYGLLRTRIVGELERARRACESETDPMEIHRAQGKASAFRVALELPNTILKDIEKPRP